MRHWKVLTKYLLILATADGILIFVYINWEKPTPDISIIELVIVPVLIIINLIIAGVIAFASSKKLLSWMFVANAFLSSVVFHYSFQLWFIRYDRANFKEYYFKRLNKTYKLELDRRDTTFHLMELSNGSAMEFKSGGYRRLADRIELADSVSPLFIYNHRLMGYPEPGVILALQDDLPSQ